MHAYEVGNYRRTIAFCQEFAPREFEGKRQLRYLVYCGLAYYEAGDAELAQPMLEEGHALLEAGNSGTLKPVVTNDLNRALREVQVNSSAKLSPIQASRQMLQAGTSMPAQNNTTENTGVAAAGNR